MIIVPSSRMRRWRGSSIATVVATNVRSAAMPCSLGSTTYRMRRSGSSTSIRSGPTVVERSSGMVPDAKIECSTPSSTMLNAASITPRTG